MVISHGQLQAGMELTIHIRAANLADAWLEAMKRVFFHGNVIRTQYDKPGDLPSRDVTSVIEVVDPLPVTEDNHAEMREKYILLRNPLMDKIPTHPMRWLPPYHKGDLYGPMSIRSRYLQEMMGEKDAQIIEAERSFPYTYHDRIFAWRPFGAEDCRVVSRDICGTLGVGVPRVGGEGGWHDVRVDVPRFPVVDQFEKMAEAIYRSPYTRRAQGITWRPYSDPYNPDCPCLQRVWVRVIHGKLTLQASWRSRDLFKAWSANATGMIMYQRDLVEYLRERGVDVEMGPYVDFCNSLHVYGDSKVRAEVFDFFKRLALKGDLGEYTIGGRTGNYIDDLISEMPVDEVDVFMDDVGTGG